MSNSLVRVEQVTKSFGKMKALDGVDLVLNANEQYVITGASGSGKSTLLYLIGGLDVPTSGRIWVDGRDLSQLNDSSLANYRNRFVGFVFQFHFLLPTMNCLHNILLPARIGAFDLDIVKKDILQMTEALGIGHCLQKFPFELSGGEQQRVNIVRALSLHPKLLLCDEPTGNLDSCNTELVVKLLKDLATANQSTLVVVTHDRSVAAQFQSRFVLKDGRNISQPALDL